MTISAGKIIEAQRLLDKILERFPLGNLAREDVTGLQVDVLEVVALLSGERTPRYRYTYMVVVLQELLSDLHNEMPLDTIDKQIEGAFKNSKLLAGDTHVLGHISSIIAASKPLPGILPHTRIYLVGYANCWIAHFQALLQDMNTPKE